LLDGDLGGDDGDLRLQPLEIRVDLDPPATAASRRWSSIRRSPATQPVRPPLGDAVDAAVDA
jgi:hypothetical protein